MSCTIHIVNTPFTSYLKKDKGPFDGSLTQKALGKDFYLVYRSNKPVIIHILHVYYLKNGQEAMFCQFRLTISVLTLLLFGHVLVPIMANL